MTELIINRRESKTNVEVLSSGMQWQLSQSLFMLKIL